jgi:hypothetical protein
MDTIYTVSVGEASRINNVDLSMRGVCGMEGVCVRRCVSTFRGVVFRTQAEFKTATGKLSCSVD